jgi:hypothetical protein
VPAASDDSPWEATVTVVADPVGTDNIFIGSRGNIMAKTPLIFPGLTSELQMYVTAFAANDFVGWADGYKLLFSEAEKARLEQVFRENMIASAREFSQKRIANEDDFIPLPLADAFSVLDITVESDLVTWDIWDTVTFRGSWNFLTYLYNADALRKILLETAKSHILENVESLTELSSAPPDIISVLGITNEPFSIKATAQIPVQILYDFTSEVGELTLQNILSDLFDAEVDRVEKTLLNHPYIKSVDIRLTPFWSDKLPNTLDRIRIESVKPK